MPEIRHDWDDEDYVESVNTAFAEYREACYGKTKLNEVQEREVRQAFFSGIHWLNTRDSYCPDDLNKALHEVCKPFFGTTNCDATDH